MSASRRPRRSARPLPEGLRICETCGAARGTTPWGVVSACWCSGLICNGCGGRAHRPITDYYDIELGDWLHVPYFALGGHRCVVPEGRMPGPRGWTQLTPDPDVLACQEATTKLALARLGPEDVIEVVDGDTVIGPVRLAE
jgi:hypothetical protein